MNCLILGGTGFLGKSLTKNLIQNGHDVTVYGRNEHSLELIKTIYPQCRIVKGDIVNESVENLMVGVDCVFYLISATNPSNLDLLVDFNSNVIPAIKVIELCAKKGIRLIFFSSGGTVYGNVDKADVPIREICETNPISAYGISKLIVEKIIRFYDNKYNFRYTILRISNPYGPGQLANKGQGVIAVFLQKFMEGEKIEIWGDGSNVRDYIYIDDLMDLCMKILDKDIRGVVNVGSGSGTSLNQILKIISDITRENITVNYIKRRSQDVDVNILDITKIRNIIDWRPKVTLETGIKNTIDYYNSYLKK